jgi:hypothetical protein
MALGGADNSTMASWHEQYDRMKRWYDRFAAIAQGRDHDVPSDNYVDEIYAFFMNCYHLKDWLKSDTSLSAAVRNAVEAHVSAQRPLCLCADICNALKHVALTTTRSGENPRFGRKQYAVHLGPGVRTSIALKYDIVTDTGSEDAFELAKQSLDAWHQFLSAHGLM